MTYIIDINIDNSAFGDTPEIELSEILSNLSVRIESEGIKNKINLYDYNGNYVGQAKLIK